MAPVFTQLPQNQVVKPDVFVCSVLGGPLAVCMPMPKASFLLVFAGYEQLQRLHALLQLLLLRQQSVDIMLLPLYTILQVCNTRLGPLLDQPVLIPGGTTQKSRDHNDARSTALAQRTVSSCTSRWHLRPRAARE